MRQKIIFVFTLLISLILACGSSNRSTESTVAERVIAEIPTLTNTPLPPDIPTQPPIPTDTPVPTQVNPIEEVKAIVASGENNINLRSGPALDFPVVGTLSAGQTLEIIGRTADSSWWQVSTPNGSAWIAASVGAASNVDENIPVVDIPANQVAGTDAGELEDKQEKPTQPSPAAYTQPANGGSIVIITVDKDEEFVDIQNVSSEAIDLTGWRLLSEKGDQNCNLDGVIQPDEILRIWAPANKADQGGFNCGFDGNIWNNSETDPAVIFDASGIEIYRVVCSSKVCQ